jgi:hypothetical protein
VFSAPQHPSADFAQFGAMVNFVKALFTQIAHSMQGTDPVITIPIYNPLKPRQKAVWVCFGATADHAAVGHASFE